MSKSFEDLFAQLKETARTRPDDSRTVRSLDAGVHAIGKKIVEEISQLLYHLQVLMLACDLDLDDVYAYL